MSWTSRSATALMRRMSWPACSTILPARVKSEKRSFFGRADPHSGGSASDFMALSTL
jgi:hypothetical protein